MRDIYQVLYRKEQELQQLRLEVEVLKTVIPLLEEDAPPALPATAAAVTVIPFERSTRTATQHLSSALRD